ncbi:hypothetical protein [Tenacibaculum ovolyticum]|uniref:hypothetical protein n=1 Tax=Tenacibaculum ovolyticum TaxID=104270 RepID=UPI003BAB5DAC
MLKKIGDLGKALDKTEQKAINGGTLNDFAAKCCHTVFGCTYVRTHATASLLQNQGYFCKVLSVRGSI